MYVHPDAVEFLCREIIRVAVEDIRNAPKERFRGTSPSSLSRQSIARRNGEDARSFFISNDSLFPLICPNIDGEYLVKLAERK